MLTTHCGRPLAAAATAALMGAGLLVAAPAGQSAGAGGRWGPVETIAGLDTDPMGAGTFDPIYGPRARPALVDVRTNGSAVTAWIAARPAPRRLLVSTRSAAGGWRAVQDLSSGVAGSVKAYDLAAGDAGTASVVWSSERGGRRWIEESHLVRGTWSVPERISRGTGPLTTIDSSGVTTLAWIDQGVWVAQRTAHTSRWTRPTLIARQPVGHSLQQLQLASSARGDLAAAWMVGRTDVLAAVRPHTSASWTMPVALDELFYLNSVRLAMDGSGRALAVWSGTGGNSQDYAAYVGWARSTPRGQWSTGRPVTRNLGEEGALVDVSMNADGLAVAGWLQKGGGTEYSSLWAARFESTGQWSAPARVSPGEQLWFDVRPWMDAGGVAHLVASRWTGGVRVFAQRSGAAWSGSTLDHDGLIDAKGVGKRLVMVFYRNHALLSRLLDVP